MWRRVRPSFSSCREPECAHSGPAEKPDVLVSEHLECQVASLVLAESQREPQPRNRVHQAHLLDAAQVHRSQPDITDQLFNRNARISVGAAEEKIGSSIRKHRVSKVLPSIRVEGAVNTGARYVLLQGG